MKAMFHRLSFRRRLWFSFVIMLCCAVATTGFFSYRIATDIVEKKVIEQSHDTLSKTVQALDESLKRMMITVLSLMLSEPMKQMIKDASIGDDSRFTYHLSALQSVFAQAKMNESLIHSMLVVTSIGEFHPLTNNRNYLVNFEDTGLYKKVTEADRSVWVESHEDLLFTDNERVLSLVITEVSERPVDGMYIILNISEEALKKSVVANIKSEGKRFMLIGDEGQPVIELDDGIWGHQLQNSSFLSSMDPTLTYGSFDYSENGEFFVDYAKMSVQQDWRLVQIQPKEELFHELNRIQWVTFIITISCILIALFISHVLTRVLFRPLFALQSLMKQVENNDLKVRYKSEYQDEVSQLGERFNRMLEQIQTLISEIRHTEAAKRMSDVKTLQAQIDPHFLYNTLNTIYMNAELNEINNVKTMILGLSKLFHLGLNDGQDITTIEREITHVTEYMNLQKQSYEELFDYSIEVEDGLLQKEIMKLILQPLVENAILHGFADLEVKGLIHIRVYRTDHFIIFEVQDNGAGMNIDAVYYELHHRQSPKHGYALRNIYQRLNLYYGEQAELILTSEPHVKTMVTLKIPMKGEMEKHEFKNN